MVLVFTFVFSFDISIVLFFPRIKHNTSRYLPKIFVHCADILETFAFLAQGRYNRKKAASSLFSKGGTIHAVQCCCDQADQPGKRPGVCLYSAQHHPKSHQRYLTAQPVDHHPNSQGIRGPEPHRQARASGIDRRTPRVQPVFFAVRQNRHRRRAAGGLV